jgi:Flp pilus assembly protein TadG
MRIKNIIRDLAQSEAGSIAIMAGLTFPVIFFIAGMAIELSRQSYVDAQLAFAVDAAAIAGAKFDPKLITQNATTVFNANYPPGTAGLSPVPTVTYNAANEVVAVSVNDQMPTILGGLLGVKTIHVSASSQVQRFYGGLELAMVLDITGSMADQNKIGGLITAATSLVDIIYNGLTTRPNTAIGIVPFVTTVNVGSNNTGWLSDPLTVNLFPAAQPWAGCLKSNSILEFADEYFDTTPGKNNPDGTVALWPTYYAESTMPAVDDCVKRDNDWHIVLKTGLARTCPVTKFTPGLLFEKFTNGSSTTSMGPNRSCSIPIMPLHNNSLDLKAYIAKLTPTNGGGTMGNLGMVWGARVLSPSWSGVWNVKQQNGTTIAGEAIKPYTDTTSQKAVIIMTDGASNWYDDALPAGAAGIIGDPTAYGTKHTDRYAKGKLGSSSQANFVTKIDDKIQRVCTALKNQGVVIYTITFRVSDPAVNAVYQKCATVPANFAAASDNASLLVVFNNIATQLKNLRIVG